SYAGVQIIKQAAEAAKSLDPKKIAEKMHSGMQFKTVLGDISYDKKGDITKLDYVMYIWKKDPSGKITYVECPGSDCSKVKKSIALLRNKSPPIGGLSFSTDLAKNRKCFEQPHAHLVDTAGEERDPGQHEQCPHGLLDTVEVIAKARQ